MKTYSRIIELGSGVIDIIFDEISPYWETDDEYNAMFLNCTIEEFNRRLKGCTGIIPFYELYSRIVGCNIITVEEYYRIKDYYFDKTSSIQILTARDGITHFAVRTSPKDIREVCQEKE